MKIFAYLFVCLLCVSMIGACKQNPSAPPGGKDSTKCDTCDTIEHPCDTCDTTHHPCDTCDTSHSTPGDTTSHAFTWIQTSLPGEVSASAAWVFDRGDILISGSSLYQYDGVSFSKLLLKDIGGATFKHSFSDNSLFALSREEFWFTNVDNPVHCLRSNDGSIACQLFKLVKDSILRLPEDGGLHASWGTSSTDMFFVGDKGTILHYDGTTWFKYPKVTTKNLYSVWGTSSTNVWACGTNTTTGAVELLHYDGTNWATDLLSTSGARSSGLYSIRCFDSAGVPVVVSSGSQVFRKTGAAEWRIDSTAPNRLSGNSYVGLYALSGNSPNDFLAVGGWGWVGHWNGRSWKRYDELYDINNSSFLPLSLSMKGNTACVVGEKSGSSWIAIGTRK